ncbi:MAG: hypothetical protein LBU91_07165 [Bacteroidales bacterium]|jgi:hypothetical protein|nr:hypothetical protein [Bacteroidales bacterium]
MDTLLKRLGIPTENQRPIDTNDIRQYIDLQLSALGLNATDHGIGFQAIAKELITDFRERTRNFKDTLCPADTRIQNFLQTYFASTGLPASALKLPNQTLCLDFYGIARELSLPMEANEYDSEYLKSYRVKQGILHNPRNDRRTTKGVFHVAEGGMPIPYDKKAVPLYTAGYLVSKALSETGDILRLPYTSNSEHPAKSWVSLLLRPTICPEVPGHTREKTMEIRFFAPGSLVSNLDFVESIFGNAGNPYHLLNDAALDTEHWSGHTGCIILAPQLTKITKKEAGLPHFDQATDRQKRDGMCWKNETELYNDGSAFKITIRTEDGLIVTVIADNYFGYSKKEVKTHISFATNLFGNTEEEHAGGAFIFPSYSQGDKHISRLDKAGVKLTDVFKLFPEQIIPMPDGYGVDANYDNIFYVPEDSDFDLVKQTISWYHKAQHKHIKLLPKKYYILPNGSKLRIERVPDMNYYRLIECTSEGSLCHKPCTVSGGGKSEISKSLMDSIFTGHFFIKDFESDFEKVKEIIEKEYSVRYANNPAGKESRKFLSPKRSMGSVIKMMTPDPDFTPEYNNWLNSIPQYIKGIAFVIKRFYNESWGDNWKAYFSVDILNGQPGNELKYNNKKLFARYLRVGFDENGNWRTFKLRQDFTPATKLQYEDDITASTVVPSHLLENLNPAVAYHKSLKFVKNCESRFFQRPDEAIVRGFDKKAESDLASPNTFISNFEPLPRAQAEDMIEDTTNFERFTEPMQNLLLSVVADKDCNYFVSSANPRLVDGKPSKNVRYLQTASNLTHPQDVYLAEIGMRIARKLPFSEPLYTPVTTVLPGRRNNPAEKDVRPLAVYNPIHYQELPELFMDFLSSLTGKSPSTTGAGSEGALTKGPFNAVLPIVDLNSTLISWILTGYPGYTTPAGYIGPNFRIDHDLSLLIPEVWARLNSEETNPKNMISKDHLEKLEDFNYKGKTVKASVLGYRITNRFINAYFGRVFENPDVVFSDNMLKPELQNLDEFVDGINNIVENQKVAAEQYFKDGSYEMAIPPLKALLSIMVDGTYEGKDLNHPDIREMFTYNYLVKSDFYADRMKQKQQSDIQLYESHIKNLEQVIADNAQDLKLTEEFQRRLAIVKQDLDAVSSTGFMKRSIGTLGKERYK